MAVEVTGSSSTITYEPLPVDDPAQRQPDITLARTHSAGSRRSSSATGLTRTAEYFRGVLDG